jgi:hypothetical protein
MKRYYWRALSRGRATVVSRTLIMNIYLLHIIYTSHRRLTGDLRRGIEWSLFRRRLKLEHPIDDC